ncbi:MAG: energy transducer TonB [bacterium]
MHYDTVFNRSLIISTTFHICIVIIFFFITFHPPIPLFKTIEISIVRLPEKEEPKPEILKPKIMKKISGVVKEKSRLKVKKLPQPIKKPIIPPPIKSTGIQEVKEIITPLPSAPGGTKIDDFHGEVPVPKSTTPQEIISTGEKDTQVSSILPPQEGKKDGETIGPYIHIGGPAGERKVLYQPKFKIPYWLEKSGQSIKGKLKIWVLPDGSIDKVELDESFGYAEIDRLAQSAVYKWRFYKLPSDIKRIDWGTVIITIKLE